MPKISGRKMLPAIRLLAVMVWISLSERHWLCGTHRWTIIHNRWNSSCNPIGSKWKATWPTATSFRRSLYFRGCSTAIDRTCDSFLGIRMSCFWDTIYWIRNIQTIFNVCVFRCCFWLLLPYSFWPPICSFLSSSIMPSVSSLPSTLAVWLSGFIFVCITW